MFDFELVYVPGVKHKGPDGLSRRKVAESEKEGEGVEEAEGWLDEIIEYGVWMASQLHERDEKVALNEREDIQYNEDIILERKREEDMLREAKELRWQEVKDERTKKREEELIEIRKFLETLKTPEKLTGKDLQYFL